MSKTDVMRRTAQTFLNPFETRDILNLPGDTPTERQFMRVAGMGATAVTLAALARLIQQKSQEPDLLQKRKQLMSHIQARYPVISLDPSTRDTATETKLQELGVPEAEKLAAVGDTSTKPNAVSSTLADYLADADTPAWLPAVGTGALIAGAAGGYSLVDWIIANRKKKQKKDAVAALRNQIDKQMFDEYQDVRGLNKQADETPGSVYDSVRGNTGVTGQFMQAPWASTKKSISTFAWAWSLATLALAYKATKTFADSKDPARRKLKALQELQRRRAMTKDAPVMLDYSGGLGDDEPIKPRSRNTASVVEPKPATQALGYTAPVDKTDSLAGLLAAK